MAVVETFEAGLGVDGGGLHSGSSLPDEADQGLSTFSRQSCILCGHSGQGCYGDQRASNPRRFDRYNIIDEADLRDAGKCLEGYAKQRKHDGSAKLRRVK